LRRQRHRGQTVSGHRDAKTIAELIGRYQLSPQSILVEHNGLVVHRHEWAERPLAEGDRVELIRVVAGGYAAQIVVSDWLLAFSLFVFLSLAFVKRFTELQLLKSGETVRGRGYQAADRHLVSTMGVASGYFAVLVLALYINQPLVTQLYHNPSALWFAFQTCESAFSVPETMRR